MCENTRNRKRIQKNTSLAIIFVLIPRQLCCEVVHFTRPNFKESRGGQTINFHKLPIQTAQNQILPGPCYPIILNSYQVHLQLLHRSDSGATDLVFSQLFQSGHQEGMKGLMAKFDSRFRNLLQHRLSVSSTAEKD
jgi:hypothetical protein